MTKPWPKRKTKTYWEIREEVRSRLAKDIEKSMAERMARRNQTPDRKDGKE